MVLGLRRSEGRLTKDDCAERVFSTNFERKSGSTRELRGLWDPDFVGGVLNEDPMASSIPSDPCGALARPVGGIAGSCRVLDPATTFGVPDTLVAVVGGCGEVVLGTLLEEVWDDFRFMVTGLFLALAWNTVFVRFALGATSVRGVIVSSLLALCNVEDDSILLGGKVSLSVLFVEGLSTGDLFTERAGRSFWRALIVLGCGVAEEVLSCLSSCVIVDLEDDRRDASAVSGGEIFVGFFKIEGSLISRVSCFL